MVDGFQLVGVPHCQLFEEEGQKFTEVLKDLEVVLLDGHFKIETYEFTHVSMGEGILGPEDGTDLEYSLEVGHNAHLLVELGRLGKATFPAEVLEVEDIRASL